MSERRLFVVVAGVSRKYDNCDKEERQEQTRRLELTDPAMICSRHRKTSLSHDATATE